MIAGQRFLKPMLATVFAGLLATVTVVAEARAQSGNPPAPGTLSRPTAAGSAGSAGAAPPRIITGSQDTEILRHRDFAGKPCLAIGGFARGRTSNPNLYDHVIEIKNGCAQSIKTQVCYRRTQQCITMDVAGRLTKEAILGTMPSIKDFQYEFRERF